MPRSQGQKSKLLYLARLFITETDENHPLTRPEISEILEKRHGINLERKTFYDDIECLRQFGMEIESVRDKHVRYYLADRMFEMPELRLLADSVGYSQFLTEKKSRALIDKLASLCSVWQGRSLKQQTDLATRNKAANETIYYNVDAVYRAILEGKKLSFRYFNWTLDTQNRPHKLYRHDGALYCVSPWSVAWDEEKYYMIAFDHLSGNIRHYRVDKMDHVSVLNEAREGQEAFEKKRPNEYTQELFNMYGGKSEQVTLRIRRDLVGVFIDRFGKQAHFRPDDGEHVLMLTKVALSPQFYGWIFSLGDGVEILSPDDVRLDFAKTLKNLSKKYK